MIVKITSIFIFTIVIACSGSKKAEVPSSTESNSLGATKADEDGELVDKRPPVDAYVLDETEFRVSGLRIGLQDYFSSESPAVSYFLPEQADYVELIRCHKDEVISNGFENLSNVEVGTSDAGEETSIFRSTNFWAAAEKKRGCTLIATDYGDRQVFIDGVAPTGGWRYLVRACVRPERLKNTEDLTSRNCSKQVTMSPVLANFRNKRVDTERDAMQEALKEQTKMDALGRAIYYTTVDLAKAHEDCYKREREREEKVQKRNNMLNMIGQGISIGASLYTAGLGSAAGASGATSSAAAKVGTTGFDWKSAFKTTWDSGKTASGAVGTGSALGSTLVGLFAKSSDYPRSCLHADQLNRQGAQLTQELKAAHELFAIKMSQAEAQRKARIDLESN